MRLGFLILLLSLLLEALFVVLCLIGDGIPSFRLVAVLFILQFIVLADRMVELVFRFLLNFYRLRLPKRESICN